MHLRILFMLFKMMYHTHAFRPHDLNENNSPGKIFEAPWQYTDPLCAYQWPNTRSTSLYAFSYEFLFIRRLSYWCEDLDATNWVFSQPGDIKYFGPYFLLCGRFEVATTYCRTTDGVRRWKGLCLPRTNPSLALYIFGRNIASDCLSLESVWMNNYQHDPDLARWRRGRHQHTTQDGDVQADSLYMDVLVRVHDIAGLKPLIAPYIILKEKTRKSRSSESMQHTHTAAFRNVMIDASYVVCSGIVTVYKYFRMSVTLLPAGST